MMPGYAYCAFHGTPCWLGYLEYCIWGIMGVGPAVYWFWKGEPAWMPERTRDPWASAVLRGDPAAPAAYAGDVVLNGVSPDMPYPSPGVKASEGLMPIPTAEVPVGPTERGPVKRAAELPANGDAVADGMLDVGSRARFDGEGVVDIVSRERGGGRRERRVDGPCGVHAANTGKSDSRAAETPMQSSAITDENLGPTFSRAQQQQQRRREILEFFAALEAAKAAKFGSLAETLFFRLHTRFH